jgi:hypothetical protein
MIIESFTYIQYFKYSWGIFFLKKIVNIFLSIYIWGYVKVS